jgi:hypothetical protein
VRLNGTGVFSQFVARNRGNRRRTKTKRGQNEEDIDEGEGRRWPRPGENREELRRRIRMIRKLMAGV